MATHVQGASNSSSVSIALTGVAAGNLIVMAVKWTGSATITSISDGTSTLTALTQYGSGANNKGQVFYLLSANSGNRTYTITWDAGWKESFIVFISEFNASTAWSFDAANGAGGVGTTASNTGNISTTGTDEVAVYIALLYDTAATLSSPTINSVAATEPAYSPRETYHHAYYRLLDATFTNGAGAGTYSTGTNWVAIIAAFKAAASGTAFTYPASGSNSVTAFSVASDGVRSRGIVRAGDTRLNFESAYERARGIVRDGSAQFILDSAGVSVFVAGSTAYEYLGDARVLFESEAVKAKGKSYLGDTRFIFDQESVRAKGKAYLGDATIVLDAGATLAKGKAYIGNGQLVLESAAVYTTTSARTFTYSGDARIVFDLGSVYKGPSMAYAYSGDGRMVYTVSSIYFESPYGIYKWGEKRWGTFRWRDGSTTNMASQGLAVTTFTSESVPGRGAAQDGAITETGQDGAWTEPPPVGAYTQDDAYVLEIKPRTVATTEGKPTT